MGMILKDGGFHSAIPESDQKSYKIAQISEISRPEVEYSHLTSLRLL